MVLNESAMLQMLEKADKILLIEPKYKKKYPALGLAKLKAYLDQKGKQVKVSSFILPEKFDLICITTLFSYHSEAVLDILNYRGFHNINTPILVGGIFASMMPKVFEKYKNVSVFRGFSKTLDLVVPDKEIMADVDPPWDDYSYVFTSRGCVNRCAYCCVWKIEPERWINPRWMDMIDHDKKCIMIFDNNLSSLKFAHLKHLIDHLVKIDKRVIFNSGFDCKYIDKKVADQIGRLKYKQGGVKLAFDRIEEDGAFQKALKLILKQDIPKYCISSYVLFNFNDTPKEADYRARECAKLGIRPYPQCYTPLYAMDKKHTWIGKHWTISLTRAFRFFWLQRWSYLKMEFADYIKTDYAINLFKLTKRDFDCFERDTKKYGE